MKKMLVGLVISGILVTLPVVGSCQLLKQSGNKVPIFENGKVVNYVEVGEVVETVDLPNGEKSHVIKTTHSYIMEWNDKLPVIVSETTYTIEK